METQIALYSAPEMEKGFDPSFHSEGPVSPDVPSIPKFVKPILQETRKKSLDSMTVEVAAKKLYRFGIVVEKFSSEIISEVTRDIINLVSSISNDARLVVVSPNSDPFWERLATQFPIDLQKGEFDLVKTWKVYWTEKKPPPPKGVRFKFDKRVGNPGIKRIILRPGLDTSYVPPNKDENRMLPLGQSPSMMRVPTRGPVQMTPQLYLWSSAEESTNE